MDTKDSNGTLLSNGDFVMVTKTIRLTDDATETGAA